MVHYRYNSSFEGLLAEIYDDFFWDDSGLIIQNVDYIISLIDKYYSGSRLLVGDLGCGTGIYCEELAKRGHDVIGIDISEDMIHEATIKRNNEHIQYIVQDICKHKINNKVDVAISMAHVIGYQHTNEQLYCFLNNVYNSLKEDGLFLFNFYHLPALYLGELEPRIKTVSVGDNLITRYSLAKISPLDNTLNLHYNYLLEDEGKVASIDIDEKMRFFSGLEMEYALRVCGFDVMLFANYLTEDPLDENHWNGMCIAKKVTN